MSTGLLTTPSLGECNVSMRPYQEDTLAGIADSFARKRRRVMVVNPTGSGKTLMMGMASRRCMEKVCLRSDGEVRPGRVMVLAHTGELIEQACNKFDHLGIEVGIEKADQYARSMFEPQCVVASVQTMKGKRLATWDPNFFDLIHVDEAHHSFGVTYKNILKYFTGSRAIGWTATADRADEEVIVGEGNIFEEVAYELTIWDLMTAPDPGPYLCKLRFVRCDVGIDLRDLRTKEGDFTDADLEARIGPLVEKLANAIRAEIGSRPTIVFTPMIKSSQAMATALQSLGIKAEWVSGDDTDRKKKIDRYQRGELQVLCNAQVLCEGFDAPHTAAIVLCRPTKSRPLYSQQVGRGTRLANGKTDCIVIDFAWLTAKHNLIKPVELCDKTGIDQEALDIAQDLMEKDPGLDIVEAVKRGEDEHRKQQVLRIKAREQAISYGRRVVDFSPIAVHDILGIPWKGSRSGDAVITRASPKQVQLLGRMGVQDAPNMSKARASTLLDYMFSQSRQNRASIKQIGYMIANGVAPDVARAMPKAEASKFLSSIWGDRKKA